MNEPERQESYERVTDTTIEAKLANELESTVDPKRKNFIQSRITVLAVLFLVTGALGIPLLWMNRTFSLLEKIIWSIVVALYTASLFYFTYAICRWSYQRIFG